MAKFRIKGMNRPFARDFASNLRELRERVGLSVRKMATAASTRSSSISAAAWCQWETGVRSPHIDRLPQIAEALGVRVHDLIPSGEGHVKKSKPRVRRI